MFIVLSIRNVSYIWIGCFLAVAILLLSVCYPLVNRAEQVWGAPLQGKTIALDPGHGGPDSGAKSAAGLNEKNVNLQICHYLRDYLQSSGAYVVMTREIDKDLADSNTHGLSRRKAEDLHRRLQLVEEKKADVLVSVHLNSIPSERWFGAQTFFNPRVENNKRLAQAIQVELVKNLGNTTRAARPKNDVYLMRESQITTALVECGFLSNPQEAAMLGSKAYQRKLAAAIYYGILHFYDKSS